MSYLDVLPIELIREISLFLDIVDIINIRDIVPASILEDKYFWLRYYNDRNQPFIERPSVADFYIDNFIVAQKDVDILGLIHSEKENNCRIYEISMDALSRMSKIGSFDSPRYLYVLYKYYNVLIKPFTMTRRPYLYITMENENGLYSLDISITMSSTSTAEKIKFVEIIDRSLYKEIDEYWLTLDQITLNEKEFEQFLGYHYALYNIAR